MTRAVLLVAIAVVASLSGGVAAQAPSYARSVVKVTCTSAGGESRGTGFAWSTPTTVVTALHVVAGCSSLTVYSEQAKNEVSARVEKVLREADLAMIRLDGPLGLEPLKEGAQPNMREEHAIWGYPRAVRTMQGDDLRFSISLKPASTLEDLMTEAEYRKSVGDQGSPTYRARILRVSSTIQPGHSGAPIFDKAGLVVGIGDGGLHQGIARVNWAIPAADYLQKLIASQESKNVPRSTHAAQFSVPVDAPPAVTTDSALQFMWTASLADILATADDDDLKEAEEFIADAHKTAGIDLRSALLDVFEDPSTGATIAVPHGVALSFDAESRMLEALSPSGRVVMYVRINADDGKKAMNDFWTHLEGLANWKADPEDEDVETREDDGQVHFERSRRVTDDSQETTAQMYAEMTIDDEDSFLGVAVAIAELDKATPEDVKLLFLFGISADLSGFVVD